MVTDAQVRRLMKLFQTEETLAIAASKVGMDEKTVRKYRDAEQRGGPKFGQCVKMDSDLNWKDKES